MLTGDCRFVQLRVLKKTNSKSKSNSNYNDSENKGHSKSEQEKYVIKFVYCSNYFHIL